MAGDGGCRDQRAKKKNRGVIARHDKRVPQMPSRPPLRLCRDEKKSHRCHAERSEASRILVTYEDEILRLSPNQDDIATQSLFGGKGRGKGGVLSPSNGRGYNTFGVCQDGIGSLFIE